MIQRNHSGFTLVELMLSMAFIGVLLITIAMTTMQIMSTYSKGLTVREVNQAGRAISEDIERTIAAVPPFTVDPAKTRSASDPMGSKYVTDPGGGRLCTGNYTYAWNYGGTSELSGDTSLPLAYNTYAGGGSEDEVIRFVKVSDVGGMLCVDTERQIVRDSARELLAAGDRNLAVQALTIREGSRDEVSGQALYAITLTLGTNDQSQLNASSTTCLPPTEGSGYENLCAINQFDIVVRAGNSSGSL